MSALAALSYLNSYFLLSSLYIIFQFYADFPPLCSLIIYHSIWGVISCCPPLPRPLSSFPTGPVQITSLSRQNLRSEKKIRHLLFFRPPEELNCLPPPLSRDGVVGLSVLYLAHFIQYSAVRSYANRILWLVLYNYDPSTQISYVVGGGEYNTF